MDFERILHELSEEVAKGGLQFRSVRETILRILTRYLKAKYRNTVSFRPGAPAGYYLYVQDFPPASVFVSNKYGIAVISAVTSVTLTDTGAIRISTDNAGHIHDAAKELTTEELMGLCTSVVTYEKLLAAIRGKIAENGEWEEYARGLLARSFPDVQAATVESFVRKHWKKRQTEDYNLRCFEQYGRR